MKYLYVFLVTTAVTLTATLRGIVHAESDGLNEKEKSLLKLLADDKPLHWDSGEESAIGELLRDEDQGVDPETEDDEMKLGVQRFMEQVQALSDEDSEKVKELFRQNVGPKETETLFQDASKLAKEEEKEMKELENDMGLQEDERKAFKELISFVIKGAKPEAEGDAELALMAQAQKKVDKLNDIDKKRLEATMVSQFGEEQTRKIFETGKNIEKEAKIKKAIAASGKV